MATKILITGALHQIALDTLNNHAGFEVMYEPDCKRERIESLIGDINILVTRSETKIDAPLIEMAKELKVIARAAVGVGNIDIPYATEKGILVLNTPGRNTNSAAELTLGMILGVMRNIALSNKHVKNGGWDRHTFSGFELRGRSIGIVGLGNVGHRVAQFAHGFDMDVYAYDPYISPSVFERYGAIKCDSLDDLASKVDILSVHVPLTKETMGMVTAKHLAMLKKGSYAINAARGGVIQEEALLGYLDNGHLGGAAVDTWLNEPTPMPELVAHPKMLVTPHIGASTLEAQYAIGSTVSLQIIKSVEGGVVDYPVNLPQIGLDNPILKPYAVLAEKLGSMAAQMIDFNPTRIELHYRGTLAESDQSLVNLGFKKGYASHVIDEYVSYVNAESHIAQLGIKFSEENDPAFRDYKSALKVKVFGNGGKELALGGLVFDETYLRISLINGNTFEISPSGNILVIENEDKPGVIGDVGSLLAEKGINIESFELSRKKAGGKAMALVKVEGEGIDAAVEELRGLKHMLSVKSVYL